MKAGAIEGLHRRLGKPISCSRGSTALKRDKSAYTTLDALEKRVEEIEGSAEPSQGWRSPNTTPIARNAPDTYNILSSLAKELRRLSEEPRHNASRNPCAYNGQCSPGASGQERGPPQKRRRIDIGQSSGCCHQPLPCDEMSNIADGRVLDALLKAYFSHVHPWIPMIHEGRLRRRLDGNLKTPEQQQRLQMLLTSIRLVGARFIRDPEIASSCMEATDERRSQVRDWVILQAMKKPSVESLQALILLAYHDVTAPHQPTRPLQSQL